MEEDHQDNNPMYGVSRNLKNTLSRDLSCYYGLRENPKKKTHKSFGFESPEEESMKKILFRCEECGKGFRYEKCLSNHKASVHFSTTKKNHRVYEEYMETLWGRFSLVKRKKRSRVIRYNKKTTPLLSCSFLESPSVSNATTDEELEVAECLILLSMSSSKFVHVSETMDANLETPRGCSYDDSGCFNSKKPRKANEQKLMEEGVLRSYETPKEPASFLGGTDMFDQQKWSEAREFESEFLSAEQEEITTGDTCKRPTSFLGHKRETLKELASFLGEKNELDQLKQRKPSDFERMLLSTELGVGTMECCDLDTEKVTESDKKKKSSDEQHQCRLCNKIFSSYQALGGHQTFHRISKSNSRMKKTCREESVEETEDESKKRQHKCSICSRLFRSFHALGGHKKGHCSKRQHLKKTEHDDDDLEFLSVVPVLCFPQ